MIATAEKRKAVDGSIEHWEKDILEPLKAGR